jgi:large subunit ribosomal protein L19
MRNQLIENFEKRLFKKDREHPNFRAGDTLKISYKIEEGSAKAGEKKKYRIQLFEGVCIRRKNGVVNGSFTVRKMGANNVGVERVFPLCSPYVDHIEVVAAGIVRRARLFYLRELTGKSARIRARRFKQGELTKTKMFEVAAPKKEAAAK